MIREPAQIKLRLIFYLVVCLEGVVKQKARHAKILERCIAHLPNKGTNEWRFLSLSTVVDPDVSPKLLVDDGQQLLLGYSACRVWVPAGSPLGIARPTRLKLMLLGGFL
nr:hypothetical protein [Nitratireductor aquibiodomus]